MINPERSRRWREDKLGIDIDLGEVTWILQCDVGRAIPSWVAPGADEVGLRRIQSGTDHVLALSICLEAMGDLGIDPHAEVCSWQRIIKQLPSYSQPSAKALYANMVNALRECLRPTEPLPENASY